MSLDQAQALREFFASAPQSKYRVDVLELSHSAMSKTYYLWKEPDDVEPNAVTTEDGVRTLEYVNFEIERAGTERNLDQVYRVKLDTTDVADEINEQLDRIPIGTTERIRCVLREYLSDALDDMLTRAVLQVESISSELGAAMLTASSPRYNVTRTGEIYSPRDVPMLRSFL